MTDVSKYTVGWICAIDTEYTAARAFLDETHEPPEAIPVHDHNAYTLGRVGKHNVVIAVLPDGEYGLSTAGAVAQRMLGSFPNVRVGLMVGIGGGAPCQRLGRDIRLGDIVVSSPRDGHTGVLQYDFGKTIQDQEFSVTRSLNLPPDVLRAAVTKLRVTFEEEGNNFPELIDAALSKKPRLRRKYGRPLPETDRLFLSHVVHDPTSPVETPAQDLLVPRPERGEDEDNPAVFYGLIASANQLMKDANIRDKFAADKGVLCFEMEAAGLMNHFPCLVIRGICDYSDSHKNKQWQGYAAMTAAAYAKALLSIVLPTKVENEKRLTEIVEVGLQNVLETMSGVSQFVDHDILNKLTVATGAAYDSKDNHHDETCLPGTRVELLQDIRSWAQDSTDRRIFWLNGMAGTGKSTISRTIAAKCAELDILGASFFFRRGESDRSSASLVFSTIARQLAERRLDLRQPIVEAVKISQDISSKHISEQFRQLLLGPFQQTSTQPTGKINILVIDALDECMDDRDAESLVALLSELVKPESFGLKLFITSRPDIATKFALGPIKGSYQEIILQEVTEAFIDKDIETYLRVKLSKVKDRWNRAPGNALREVPMDWPAEETLETLVKRARPLFIFAATVCRFVGDFRLGSPQEQLEYITRAVEDRGIGGNMTATYLSVLHNLSQNGCGFRLESSYQLQSFHQVIGKLILLEQPLRAESLASLINTKATDICRIAGLLRSVLDISEDNNPLIQLFHLSFRDFLLSSEAGKFRVNFKATHKQIALDCIKLLSDGKALRYNMCDLQPGDDLSQLDSQLTCRQFPPHIRYACCHMIDHLEQSEDIIKENDDLHKFLRVNLLYWMEALCLLGESSALVKLPGRLLRLIEVSPERDLSKLVEDFDVFTHRWISNISLYPLQLYWSALPFSPHESTIRKAFANCIPTSINFVSKPDSYWPALKLIDADEAYVSVTSLAISPDSTYLACGGQNADIEVWSLSTSTYMCGFSTDGKCDYDREIVSLAFSADSARLLAASYYHFYIFDMETRCLAQTFSGVDQMTIQIDTSHHSDEFASVHTDGTVAIWSEFTDDEPRWLEDPGSRLAPSKDRISEGYASDDLEAAGQDSKRLESDAIESEDPRQQQYLSAAVGYSKDSELIAGYFRTTNTTHIWRVATGQLLHRLKSTSDDHFSRVFSSSSMVPSIRRKGGDVDIFDIATGCRAYTLPSADHRGQIAISPDARYAASTRTSETTVTIWNLRDGEIYKSIPLRTLSYRQPDGLAVLPDLIFSGDGRYLVMSNERYIGIWSMSSLDRADSTASNQSCDESQVSHGSDYSEILASTDHLVVTVFNGSSGRKVKVYSTTSGRVIQTLEIPKEGPVQHEAQLSPDHRYLFVSDPRCRHRILNIDSGDSFTMNLELYPPETFSPSNQPRIGVAFSHDSMLVAVSGPQGAAIYKLLTGQCLWYTADVLGPLVMLKDGRALLYCTTEELSADFGSLVKTYSLTTTETEVIHRFSHEIYAMGLSPDSAWTFFETIKGRSEYYGGLNWLWLVDNHKKNRCNINRSRGHFSTAFSHDSTKLAEACMIADGQYHVKIWSLLTLAVIHVVEFEPDYITSGGGIADYMPLAFSDDDKTLVLSFGRVLIDYASAYLSKSAGSHSVYPSSQTVHSLSGLYGYGFQLDEPWIINNGRGVVLLPPEWACSYTGDWGYTRVHGNYIAWLTSRDDLVIMRTS